MFRIFKGDRPDVTPAQIVAALLAGVPIISNLLHAFGVFDLSKDQEDAIKDTLGWAFGSAAALVFADAHIRKARNHAKALVDAAAVQAPAALPPVTSAWSAPVVGVAVSGTADTSVGDLPSDEEEFASGPAADDPEARIAPDSPDA